MYRYLSIIIFIASLSGIGASAQKWALKSNLLYDATGGGHICVVFSIRVYCAARTAL